MPKPKFYGTKPHLGLIGLTMLHATPRDKFDLDFPKAIQQS